MDSGITMVKLLPEHNEALCHVIDLGVISNLLDVLDDRFENDCPDGLSKSKLALQRLIKAFCDDLESISGNYIDRSEK